MPDELIVDDFNPLMLIEYGHHTLQFIIGQVVRLRLFDARLSHCLFDENAK